MKVSLSAILIGLTGFTELTNGYVITTSESTWETLTPTATWSGGLTDFTTTFGIAVATISSDSSSATASASASNKRRKREAISQISDGQIQATTSTTSSSSSATTDVVSQISDGQIQETTSTSETATTLTTSYISSSTSTSDTDDSDSSDSSDSSDYVTLESCKTSSSLAMILEDSILTDAKGRIGSIVANHQFQFDGPPPQAGAIYAKGWEITQDGYLAIGDNDVFYQCLSGSFYNLYDENIGSECYAIHLEVVILEDCD